MFRSMSDPPAAHRAVPLALVFLILLAGCATVNTQIEELSPQYGELSPRSILVLPIMNETPDLDAPEAFRPRVQDGVRRRGYQTVDAGTVDETLREEGVIEAGQVNIYSPRELGELFETDAVLYTVVTEWKTTYFVAYAMIGVGARFELVDTRTETVLWKWEKAIYDRRVAMDRETALETAIFALQPYEPYVDRVVSMAFATLPARTWREPW